MRGGDKRGRRELAELVRFDEARSALVSEHRAETAKTAGSLRYEVSKSALNACPPLPPFAD